MHAGGDEIGPRVIDQLVVALVDTLATAQRRDHGVFFVLRIVTRSFFAFSFAELMKSSPAGSLSTPSELSFERRYAMQPPMVFKKDTAVYPTCMW